MEIQLNKDLQKFQDNVVLGLNARQTVFGGIGAGLGIAVFLLASKKGLTDDISSIITSATVAPFAALGFVNYNGMTFERLVKVWIKQFFLCPKKIISRPENLLYKRDKEKIEKAKEKEAKQYD
ncbi:MAG: PrgI family protein [Eubacterium sp.]|nr:PrgI family protein [Eubacterium sp.]